MKKMLCLLLALALSAGLFAGCRGNVSNNAGGKITAPTETMATMPSTDTTPMTTESMATEPMTTDPMNTSEPAPTGSMTTEPSAGNPSTGSGGSGKS